MKHGITKSRWAGFAGLLLGLISIGVMPVSAQRAAKYGSDFLSGGVGARALGMGGAYVALAGDVTSGYWNPAGLSSISFPEVAYMHAERFAGIVSYDYGSGAFPINSRSTIGLSMIRLGVDDIPNTLNAWDRERNQPLPDVQDRISRFSYAHYAFFVSYARVMTGCTTALAPPRSVAATGFRLIPAHNENRANGWAGVACTR